MRELTVSQGACEALAAKLRDVTQQNESTQRGLAQHTQEELRVLKESLSKASAERVQLEEDNKRLEKDKAKLEVDYQQAIGRLDQMLAERRQLEALWGVKEGEKDGGNVVDSIRGEKTRLEGELQTQRVQLLDLESEVVRLKTDLGEAEMGKATALERLAKAESSMPRITILVCCFCFFFFPLYFFFFSFDNFQK